ncbi:MAG: N-acetylglucosamine-6-phosphate deacetylase [Pyrinomonas methylaliphatogenes]|nr:N-acetylglucosamine-6-phosphate deacetylase [Pyrinomonas methylaliphatogenes]
MSEGLLLRNAQVVLSDGSVKRAAVLIEGGRIARITEDGAETDAGEIADLEGAFLLPGFIDLHIHGAVGADVTETDVDGLRKIARFLVREGVTSWLPTLVPAPDEDYKRAAGAIEELMAWQETASGEGEPTARALGLHYEGPFVNQAQCGALRTEYFRVYKKAADLEPLTMIANPRARHMMTVAPEIEGGIELVRELRRRGFIVSIGHTRADIASLDQAFEAGARHMTHFMNAMAPLHHRAPGPIGWGLLRDDVTCDVIADGIHVEPFMLRLILKCKGIERISLISDAVAPTGLGDGVYQVWGGRIAVLRGRTSNERGSIAGSVITLSDAVRLMLQLGVSIADIARMAATNPARLLGVIEECGTIEEGKRADLVALDESGEVRLTIVGGRVAFNADDLEL